MTLRCAHDEFHTVRSAYDHGRALLVFYWACERCGARLHEIGREEYSPRFDPRGNEKFLTAR